MTLTRIVAKVSSRIERGGHSVVNKWSQGPVCFNSAASAEGRTVIADDPYNGGVNLLRQWKRKDQPGQGAVGKSHREKSVTLLIHGIGQRAGWMAPLADELRKRDDALIYALDLPEIGRGKVSLNSKTLEKAYRRIRDTIEMLGSDGQDVRIVGHSLGGFLTTKTASELSAPLAAVTLLNPALKPNYRSMLEFLPEWRKRLQAIQKCFIKAAPAKPGKPRTRAKLNPVQMGVLRDIKANKDGFQGLTVPSVLTMPFRMWKLRHTAPSKMAAPVQIITGGKDHLVNNQGAGDLFKALNSGKKVMLNQPEAPHHSILDPAVETVADDIVQFWQGLN